MWWIDLGRVIGVIATLCIFLLVGCWILSLIVSGIRFVIESADYVYHMRAINNIQKVREVKPKPVELNYGDGNMYVLTENGVEKRWL